MTTKTISPVAKALLTMKKEQKEIENIKLFKLWGKIHAKGGNVLRHPKFDRKICSEVFPEFYALLIKERRQHETVQKHLQQKLEKLAHVTS